MNLIVLPHKTFTYKIWLGLILMKLLLHIYLIIHSLNVLVSMFL